MSTNIFFNCRDNGITISISIIQWAFEVMNMVLWYSYIFLFHGNSNFMDKFFSLYLISFTMIIQPAFYLNGDFVFRRNWAVKGPIKALKIALFQWLYSLGDYCTLCNNTGLKEVQIVYRLFLVNCYLLHVPRLPSQPTSNGGGLVTH